MATLGTIVAASPLDAIDANVHNHTVNGNNDDYLIDLNNMPSDFGTMLTLNWTVTYKVTNQSNDTFSLLVRIMDAAGTTCLAGADSGGGWQTVNANVTNSTDQTDGPTAFTWVNTTADRTAWDGAVVQLRQNVTKSAGWDSAYISENYFAVTGTYTQGSVTLTVAGATHTQTSAQPSLTQQNTLAVQDAAQAQSAEQPSLTQQNTLVVADAAQGQAAENVDVIFTNWLLMNDAAHSHTAENVTLQLPASMTAAYGFGIEVDPGFNFRLV